MSGLSLTAPEIDQCRSCQSPELVEVLNLGALAISDFTQEGEPERAPLVLLRCDGCTLVQLKHTVPRDRLYRKYFYKSGIQESMVTALRDVVQDASKRVSLGTADAVVDIGANDGTLLRMWPREVKRLGFEPAENLYAEASVGGNVIASAYWPPKYGLRGGAKVITSIACFYDTEDPNAFVAQIKEWLHPDGVWINQLAYLPDTLRANNFGDIVHEHLHYWTGYAFERLLHRHGLQIVDSSFNDVNGGSVRFVVKHDPEPILFCDDAVTEHGLRAFAVRIEQNRRSVVRHLRRLKAQGKTVLGYGASTKGNTYLQYWGLTPDLLPAIADRNPEKWGTATPGTGIPIISEEDMRARRPDYLVVLPWHFLPSFKEREWAFLDRGGQFLVPFPTVRMEGLDGHHQSQAA